MSIPYLPLFVADYEADTAHLTMAEDGAYMRLLRLCWRTEGCSIPDDPDWIMRRLRVDREEYERIVQPVLNEFFKRRRGRLYNARLSREHARIKTVSQTRSESGRKGGRPRKPLKDNDNEESKRLAKEKQNESIQSQSQTEDNTTPSGCSAPDFEDEFWRLKPKAEAAGVKSSLMGRMLQVMAPPEAIDALQHALTMKSPAQYIGGILKSRAPPRQQSELPEAIQRHKAAGEPVTPLGNRRWKVGWDILNDKGEVVGI